ncbi:MAG: hypothetical protein AB9891_11380 [Anaerolineaceae bacterium]
MQIPILSVIIFTPLLAGLIILLLPAEQKKAPRAIALAAGLVSLVLSIGVYLGYDISAGGYQFIERVPWIPGAGNFLLFRRGRHFHPALPAGRDRGGLRHDGLLESG